jgi:DNA-binding beta-propeller fold protein YncE
VPAPAPGPGPGQGITGFLSRAAFTGAAHGRAYAVGRAASPARPYRDDRCCPGHGRGLRDGVSRPRASAHAGVGTGGSFVLVVGVRGRRVEAYSAGGRILGTARVGVGPTHVQAGRGRVFYVADTEGGAVLVFRVSATGPRQVGTVRTGRGAPYGLAVDRRRGLVYATLTATSQLESFRISGDSLVPDQMWPAVRQPNSVAVDEATGRVFIADRADNQLELIDPGTHGTPAPH